MKNDDTKEKLLQSVLELSETKTLDKITVKQIAENCGVTSQTFYNHFNDKYDMVIWAYKKRIDRLMDCYLNHEITWRGFLDKYLDRYLENAKFAKNAFKNTRGEDSYAARTVCYFSESLEKTIRIKCKDGEFEEEFVYLIKLYASGVINLVAFWVDGGKYLTQEEMVDILYDGMPQKLHKILCD